MSKLNILFNHKNYNIDSAALAAETDELKRHISTELAGSDITVMLNGVSYNIDNAKLSTVTNDFIRYLGMIHGDGTVVRLNKVDYNLDSSKLTRATIELEELLNRLHNPDIADTPMLAAGLYETGAIAQYEAGNIEAASAMLKTSWEDLISSGAVVVSEGTQLPEGVELNEYGFYFGVEYTAVIPNIKTVAFVFNENGSVLINDNGEGFTNFDCEVVYEANTILLYRDGLATIELAVSENGTHLTHVGEFINYYIDGYATEKGTLTSGIVDGETFMFDGDLVLPDDSSVIRINKAAFIDQTSLTGVIITGSIDEIGENAFYSCSSLTDIVVPSGVTRIGSGAFYYCSGLTSIVIPEGVELLGDGAFYRCNNLASVTIPSSLTSLGSLAFSGCGSLESIVIPGNITSFGSSVFSDCSRLGSVIIQDGATYIGDNAFNGCSGLASVTIPGSVTSIGWQAFRSCSSLTSIEIPDGVAIIEDFAFYMCSNLATVTLPESITDICGRAFFECSNLSDIRFEGTMEQWASVYKGDSWHAYTPATHVQCSDGQVAL